MKKIACTLLIIFTVFIAFSQTYNMPSGSGIDSATTCSGTFYDTGGSNGNHGTNQSSTMIFHPGTPGMAVRLVFSTFTVADGATMTIYDGTDNTAVVIALYDANISPIGLDIVATSDNPTGSITVEFTSGTNNEVGWAAAVDCRAPCQAYTIGIDPFTTTKPLVDSIYFNVCLGETVTFCAAGNYPQNGHLYTQSDSTTTFTWRFGTNEDAVEGQCITRTFDHFQGWDFVLTAQDEQNCYPSSIFKGRVRVSDNPLQNVQELPDMCSGTIIPIVMDTSDNATIGIGVVSNAVSGTLSVADTTFLPDGSNISYTSDLEYSIFEPGQTLTDISDLLGICLSLEHSYLGDLRIRITCPSGQTCLLKAYSSGESAPAGVATSGSSNGGNIHLGFAPDPGSTNPCYLTYGVGLDYCFTPQATASMGSGGPTTSITYTDPCGNTETWNQLNAGDYGSYENMNALVGCQLNGAWRITVTDCLASDNGYIFSWGLSLSDRIIPGGWGYDVDLANVTWSGYNIEPTENDSALFAANINADAPGDYTYTVTMEDEYACVYDTTFFVTIIQTPEPSLGDDVNLCIGENTTLDPHFNYLGTPGSIDYSWTTVDDNTE
ncbi:MAG TPA: proprotein convertase P-domain-containing protein, partial [Bacteroidales bacterium]|nr:proprotein convertase P-domain-containing protein [Bacteroidales bacterium]HPT53170.1 proprotein convertase P-domain-containing protein [Bacteroidales bacterium]